jgi:hypothetical protein
MTKCILKLLIPASLYVLLLLIVYLIHVNFLEINVIFYAAIFDAGLSLLLFASIFFLTKWRNYYNSLEILQSFIIFFLLGYSLSISLPTVIDRSLSFYILEKISAHNGSIKSSAMRDIFINDYINEYKLVEVRITEQVESGTIEVQDGCVNLTSKGEFIASFSSYFRRNFLAKKRLLLHEYTDVLTDPLKNSAINAEYFCTTEIKN